LLFVKQQNKEILEILSRTNKLNSKEFPDLPVELPVTTDIQLATLESSLLEDKDKVAQLVSTNRPNKCIKMCRKTNLSKKISLSVGLPVS